MGRARTRGQPRPSPALASESLDEARHASSADLRSLWTWQHGRSHDVDATASRPSHSQADLRYDRSGSFAPAIAASFDRPVDNTLAARAEPEVATYAAFVSARRRWASVEAELGARLDGQRYSDTVMRQQFSPRLNLRYDFAPVLASLWLVGAIHSGAARGRVAARGSAGDAGSVRHRRSTRSSASVPAGRRTFTSASSCTENGGPRSGRTTRTCSTACRSCRISPPIAFAWRRPRPKRRAPSSPCAARCRTRSKCGAGSRHRCVADDFESISDVRRSWDQPRATTLGAGWTNLGWTASAVLGWHRGWPRTDVADSMLEPGMLIFGRRNADRWGDYFSADLSASRTARLRGRGALDLGSR